MNNKRIITTLAIAAAVVAGGSKIATAQTFTTGVVANLGGSPYLHLRGSASINSPILDNIQGGTTLKIIAQSNGWAKVEYDGTIGFVSVNYLNENSNQAQNSSQEESSNSYTVYTNYDTNIKNYSKKQEMDWSNFSAKQYENYINPNNSNSNYEFLRIDRYRNINVNGLNQVLQNDGVLSGQGQVINDAAKTYNIDPLYLASQSILETGQGQSVLAQGVTINEIANTNEPIYQNGFLVGYQMIKLANPVTVFNLFGIGARNNLPGFENRALILGTTYAYEQGWTSVPKAIYGAAKFLSNTYVNNNYYNQNTPYKLRYTPDLGSIWHEYATRADYGQTIGNLISQYSYLYSEGDKFLFDIPVFNN